MNAKAQGAVSGAVSGAKAGGLPGAIIGGILGAARTGGAQSLAEGIAKRGNGTLQTPSESMKTPQEQLWEDEPASDAAGDMLAMTPADQANVAQGIDNGYGDFGDWG